MTAAEPRYLRECWYVIALADELETTGLLSRKVLGQPILVMRNADGTTSAIADRCPHRLVPLSKGTFDGSVVRCAYHGLGFDGSGRCVENPHGPITSALRARPYPVALTGPLIWVWMGDPDRCAKPAPAFACLAGEDYLIRSGYIHGAANYQLMADNILDLSHIEFLHPALGTDAVRKAAVAVKAEGDSVVTTRIMENEILPPGLAHVYQTAGATVRRTMRVTWQAPSLMELKVQVEPLDGPERHPRGSTTLHLFTPETANSAHYFYVGAMDRALFTTELMDTFRTALGRAFTTEDKPMIDAQQAAIGPDHDIMDLGPALLGIDKAPMLARRKLARLIEEEAAPGQG